VISYFVFLKERYIVNAVNVFLLYKVRSSIIIKSLTTQITCITFKDLVLKLTDNTACAFRKKIQYMFYSEILGVHGEIFEFLTLQLAVCITPRGV
jgi:hypothetical protein